MKKIRGAWLPDSETKMGDGPNPYQAGKYRAARDLCRQRRFAVDVGAHVGTWTMQMLEDFQRVVAFEPDLGLRACWDRNVGGRAELHAVALGAAKGRAGLQRHAGTTLKTCVDPAGSGTLVETLDSFRLEGVDLLKIDVEGFEVFVVRGGWQTIRRDRPVVVVEQKVGVAARRYGAADREAVYLLSSWGYLEHADLNGNFVMVPG